MPESVIFDRASNQNQIKIDVKNLGSTSVRSTGIYLIQAPSSAYNVDNINSDIKNYLGFAGEKIIFSPNESHSRSIAMKNPDQYKIRNGKEFFILVAVSVVSPFGKNYIRYSCNFYNYTGEESINAGTCPNFNDLVKQGD